MAGRTRTRTLATHPSPPSGALVASSAHYSGAKAPRVYGTDKNWQQECYRFYSIIGEARYGAQYYGNALSKCSLSMSEPVISENGSNLRWEPTYVGDASAALDEVFSGKANQSQMLHDVGVHLTVAGECFVIGRFQQQTGISYYDSTVGDGAMLWEVVSPLEVATTGQTWALQFPGYPQVNLTEQDVVVRIWRPDPAQRLQADSPFKSLLPVLKEIENLDLHINSQLISRITSAGIMWVSSGMDFPAEQTTEGEETTTANGPTRLMRIIAETGAKALREPGSAAARVPIIIQVPDDILAQASQLMHFWSDLDQNSQPMRAAAIHRFASGMDLPNEMIEGMSSNSGTGGGTSNGVSHWGAWMIEESAIKIHIEPMLDLICNAFTVDYVRVVVPETSQVVGYSTIALRLRPDRSKEAFELWDRGILTDEALLRECGFDASDLPSADQQQAWLLRKIATGSNTPEQVAAAAKAFGVTLPTDSGAQVANEARPAPSLVDHPSRPRDPSEQAASAELMVACNAMVLQALQRVGNRLIQAGVRPDGVPQYAVHTFAAGELDPGKMLAGAFPMAGEVLDGIADPADVMPHLTAYVSSLVARKAAHDKTQMAKWLEKVA